MAWAGELVGGRWGVIVKWYRQSLDGYGFHQRVEEESTFYS